MVEGNEKREQKKALANLARVISDPEQRGAFYSDPGGTLGEDWKRLPELVRDALSGASPDELAALSRLHEALVESGLAEDVDGGELGVF